VKDQNGWLMPLVGSVAIVVAAVLFNAGIVVGLIWLTISALRWMGVDI
jgi:high-affinity K+ transport system ATPase subunit B